MLISLERLAVVFVAASLGCLAGGLWMIRRLRSLRWLQPIRHEDCPPLLPLQQHKQGTPTMGGLFVLAAGVAVAALFGGLSHRHGWLVLIGLAGLGMIGLIDDWLKLRHPNAAGLRSRPKLIAALAVGGAIGFILAVPGTRTVSLPWLARHLELGWVWVPLAAVVIAGCSHAVNLTDGMDGLASGCLAMVFGVLALWGFFIQDPVVAVWSASLAGVCIGFLWFNAAPASVFLGDVGALGLGAALGVLAILADAMLALVVIGGVFVTEAVSVILQVASYRWRNKRRIFRVAPLHHHFQVGGVAEQKLVVRFWIVGMLLAAVGLTALLHA